MKNTKFCVCVCVCVQMYVFMRMEVCIDKKKLVTQIDPQTKICNSAPVLNHASEIF